MNNDKSDSTVDDKQKITVESAGIEGIAAAVGMELVEEPTDKERTEFPAEMREILDTLTDIYEGVQVATDQDSRGRSRKMVRQYADRENLGSDELGHILRVLEGHDFVVQDGNRWRVPEAEE